jgi:uncharacterized membrane protein YfcA
MFEPWFVARAFGLGSLIGFALGALGAGGSLLTVPILVYAMGVPVQGATGTSLAIVALNAATGALDYLRRRRSLPRTGFAIGVSGLFGAFAGVWLNHQLPGDVILLLFSLLMLLAAASMLRRRSVASLSTAFDEHYPAAAWLRLVLVGLGVGLLTGFFGIGGGFLVVPALVIVLRLPMSLAVGTSLLVIAMNALWGLLGNVQLGTLDWTLTALFALGGIAGVLSGAKLADRLPDGLLRTAFALIVVGVAVYTFVRSATTLLGG